LVHTTYVSVGGALARAGDSAETLFGRADAALYTAKHNGRNRYEVAE
jgi:PleD family two-component response regulator